MAWPSFATERCPRQPLSGRNVTVPAALTPGIDWICRNAESLKAICLASELYLELGGDTRIVSTFSGLKPRLPRNKCAKLRSVRPAAVSKINDNAISETTKALRNR